MRQSDHRTGRVSLKQLLLLLPLLLMSVITPSHGSDWVYTVRPGDNIWQLSHQYLINPNRWPEVQKRNNVTDAQAMQPGTQLSIPVEWLKNQPRPARLLQNNGEITLLRNGKPVAITPATTINSGDTLTTGANGSATIEFADGSRLLLQSNSEVVMDSLGGFDASGMVDTSVRLKRGRIENRVAPQKPDGRYRIITPAAVAAVRGTEFRVGGDDGGNLMRNEVLEGNIAVTGAGVTREVPTGYGTVAETGKPPSEPQPLPLAPDLGGLTRSGSPTGISFSWLAVNEAVGYRAQLSEDETFTTLLRDDVVDNSTLNWSGLSPASYTLRLRAINALGIEGFDARHNFTIIAPPAAPIPTTPEDGAVLAPGRPWISWSQNVDANTYHLQLASDPQFTTLLQENRSIVNNHYRPVDELPAGHYYWRIASISSNIHSAFSTPRLFVLSSAPVAPAEVSATLTQRDASFSWPAVEGAVQYQFQLGHYADFTALSIDTNITKNSIQSNQLAPGRYHYRVRAINGDGRIGPFSEAGELVVEITP